MELLRNLPQTWNLRSDKKKKKKKKYKRTQEHTAMNSRFQRNSVMDEDL